MAFDKKLLSGNVGEGGGVPTLFTYNTPDTQAIIVAANYFNSSADIFEVNDLIMAEAVDGFVIYRVSANDKITVTVVAGESEV